MSININKENQGPNVKKKLGYFDFRSTMRKNVAVEHVQQKEKVVRPRKKKSPTGNTDLNSAPIKRQQILTDSNLLVEGGSSQELFLSKCRVELGELISEQSILKAKEKKLRQTIRRLQQNIVTTLTVMEDEPVDDIIARIFNNYDQQRRSSPRFQTSFKSVLWEMAFQKPQHEESRKRRRVHFSTEQQETKNEEVSEKICEEPHQEDGKDMTNMNSILSQLIDAFEETNNSSDINQQQITDFITRCSSKIDFLQNHTTVELFEQLSQFLSVMQEMLIFIANDDVQSSYKDFLVREFSTFITDLVSRYQRERQHNQQVIMDPFTIGATIHNHIDVIEIDSPAQQQSERLTSHFVNLSQNSANPEVICVDSPESRNHLKVNSMHNHEDIFSQLEKDTHRLDGTAATNRRPEELSYLHSDSLAPILSTNLSTAKALNTSTTSTLDLPIASQFNSSSEIDWSSMSDDQLKDIANQYGLKFEDRRKIIKILRQISVKFGFPVRTAPSSKTDKYITSKQLQEFLQTQHDLYQQILCFIPISLDEVLARVMLNGYLTSKDHLLQMLDSLAVFVSPSASK